MRHYSALQILATTGRKVTTRWRTTSGRCFPSPSTVAVRSSSAPTSSRTSTLAVRARVTTTAGAASALNATRSPCAATRTRGGRTTSGLRYPLSDRCDVTDRRSPLSDGCDGFKSYSGLYDGTQGARCAEVQKRDGDEAMLRCDAQQNRSITIAFCRCVIYKPHHVDGRRGKSRTRPLAVLYYYSTLQFVSCMTADRSDIDKWTEDKRKNIYRIKWLAK